MIHTLRLGVPSAASLDFWAQRLGEPARFTDPDGLQLELVVADAANPPLRAAHPEIPAEHAITGVEGARAYADPGDDRLLTDALGFTDLGDGAYRVDGARRRFDWAHDTPPQLRGRPGSGTVHHIAWATADDDQLEWRRRVGPGVTPVIDRDYFKSIYFREPHGVLFEIATVSPGFAVDEDPEHLGESLRLPPQHEHLRPQLERLLTPVVNPRAAVAS